MDKSTEDELFSLNAHHSNMNVAMVTFESKP